MAKKFFRACPPYPGREPYLYLCFCDGDAKAVKPLLARLYERHCRVWYSLGRAQDTAGNRERAERISRAALMVIVLTPNSADDEAMKSALGYYLTTGKPVIAIESGALPVGSSVPLLFTEQVHRLSTDGNTPPEELAAALMRTDGFVQEMIFQPGDEFSAYLIKHTQKRQRNIALTVLAAAILAIGGTFVYGKTQGWFDRVAALEDTVTISDPVIWEAAHTALSPTQSVPLSDQTLAQITTLHLTDTPLSFEELALFPALTRLEIPVSCVDEAAKLVADAPYSIVVYGEAGQ